MPSPSPTRWSAETAALRAILAGLPLSEETKWGKACYLAGGRNVVIIQPFKDYIGLGFFQGALLSDPEGVLVQLGVVRAGRVMKFTSAQEIEGRRGTIEAYVREAIGAALAGRKVEAPRFVPEVPDELTDALEADEDLRVAFEGLTPGRQRSWLFHFAGAKQSATRVSRVAKARSAILAGRGFLER